MTLFSLLLQSWEEAEEEARQAMVRNLGEMSVSGVGVMLS